MIIKFILFLMMFFGVFDSNIVDDDVVIDGDECLVVKFVVLVLSAKKYFKFHGVLRRDSHDCGPSKHVV